MLLMRSEFMVLLLSSNTQFNASLKIRNIGWSRILVYSDYVVDTPSDPQVFSKRILAT